MRMSMCIAVKVGFLVVLIEERSPYHNIGQAPHSHYQYGIINCVKIDTKKENKKN